MRHFLIFGYLYFVELKFYKQNAAMKKYLPLIIVILITFLIVYIAIKWTTWDSIIIIVVALAGASYYVIRSLNKGKKAK